MAGFQFLEPYPSGTPLHAVKRIFKAYKNAHVIFCIAYFYAMNEPF